MAQTDRPLAVSADKSSSEVVCQHDGFAAASNSPNQPRPFFPLLFRKTLLVIRQALIDFCEFVKPLAEQAFGHLAGFTVFRLVVKDRRITKCPLHTFELIGRAASNAGVGKLFLTDVIRRAAKVDALRSSAKRSSGGQKASAPERVSHSFRVILGNTTQYLNGTRSSPVTLLRPRP